MCISICIIFGFASLPTENTIHYLQFVMNSMFIAYVSTVYVRICIQEMCILVSMIFP